MQELYLDVQERHRDAAAPLLSQSTDLIERLRIVYTTGLDQLTDYHAHAAEFVSAALAPRFIPLEELGGDVQRLRFELELNGQVRQHANTREMIFKIPEILAFVSKNFTLEAGDIVITGTPSGVGPLVDGDVVEVEIENIGILRNPVRAEHFP